HLTRLYRYAHSHHSDHTSFPTRRSSDLGCDSTHEIFWRFHIVDVDVAIQCHPAYFLKPKHLPSTFCPFAKRQRRERLKTRTPILDRKSTRLNSSHEWISYAVFCLKQKRR